MNPGIEGLGRRILDKVITCAAIQPDTLDLYCGTEQGECLRFLGGDPQLHRPQGLKQADDAINGIAFAGDYLGLSTPSEVRIYRLEGDGPVPVKHLFEGGAFGIQSTRTREFIAPLGPEGILLIDPAAKEEARMRIAKPSVRDLNFYRLTRLAMSGHKDIFACACRDDGLCVGGIERGSHEIPLSCNSLGGKDIVDVCSLNDPRFPYAVACVDRSNGVYLIQNLLVDGPIAYEPFQDLSGIAYTILASRGHLFVLTDTGLVIVPNFIAQFLEKRVAETSMDLLEFGIDASDMYLRSDRELIFIVEGGIEIYHVDQLAGVSNVSWIEEKASNFDPDFAPIHPRPTHSQSKRTSTWLDGHSEHLQLTPECAL